MGILQKLLDLASALDDIITKAPQVQTALEDLDSFLEGEGS